MACLSTGAIFSNFPNSLVYSNLNNSHLSKLDFQSSPFIGIVLSFWDNIIGPRLGHIWLESEEKCTEDMVKYVVSHTLNGELARQAPKNAVDTRLFIIKERNLVFSSFIFTGLSKGAGETLYSLSLLWPFQTLKGFLPFQELVDIRMKVLVAKLRILQEKDLFTSALNFSKHLITFITTMSTLQSDGIPSDLSIWDSAFAPGNSSCFNSTFLEKSITSHLETFGSTVVVGKTAKSVNLMINTLALFLSSHERCQSRYVKDGTIMEHEPDLFIQGIVMKENGSYKMSSKSVLTNRFPTTLINLEKEEVFQSCLFGQHSFIRQEFLNVDLECVWKDSEDAPLYPELGLFHKFEHESKIINDMLSDIQLLPPQDSIRLVFIENFNRLLRRKALALIKYIEDISKFGYDRINVSGLKEARQQLHLTKDGDFYIILAMAEKLRPNIYTCVMAVDTRNGMEVIYRNVLGSL